MITRIVLITFGALALSIASACGGDSQASPGATKVVAAFYPLAFAAETIGGETFDGNRKTAIFPGDLPERSDSLFQPSDSISQESRLPHLNIVRFRPPNLEESGSGATLSIPHIRLDRALQFLIGDRLA